MKKNYVNTKSFGGYQPIDNKLFLNYLRQNGKPWINGGLPVIYSGGLRTGSVKVISEILVPSSSDAEYASLTAMSNSLFVEARRHNMSMSPFGHLDPVKFCLAAIYPCLMLSEVRRALGIVGEYQFSNVAYGETLATAAGFNFSDAVTNYVAYCKKFNILAARINALLVPKLSIVNRWLDHRIAIYKDDEGERFQFYLYVMQNYYKLIVDPNDPAVGRLKCMWDIPATEALSAKLSRIEALVASYESDDDMVQFATEAIQAGMGHIEIEPIPVLNDSFARVEFVSKYSLDDIMSLENAKVVTPITAGASLIVPTVDVFNWDIWENTITGKFVVGTTDAVVDRLPIVHPLTGAAFLSYRDEFGNAIKYETHGNYPLKVSDFPIYTHAKIKSIDGLTKLTRYIYACAEGSKVSTSLTSIKLIRNGVEVTDAPNTNAFKSYITCHGTELISCIRSVDSMQGVPVATTLPIIYHFIPTKENTSGLIQDTANTVGQYLVGFKAVIALYAINGNSPVSNISGLFIKDYDYVTSVNDDTLSTFFGVNAWNDMRLDTSSVSIGSKVDSKDSLPSEEK